MANVSNWKGHERDVAEALGGKRRLRTMESYGKKATDVYFPKEIRKKYPFLENVMIECKKKKQVNIYTEMTIAKLKYATTEDALIILACKKPAPKDWKKRKKILARVAENKLGLSEKKAQKLVRRDMFIDTIVAVDLKFFARMFKDWKHEERRRHERSSGESKSRD